MADESSGRPPFWNMAGLFRQAAGPFGGLRGFEELSTWGPLTAMEVLLDRVRASLVGRRVEMQVGGGRLAFTLKSLTAKLDPMATAAGQADDVALTAEEVDWSGMQCVLVTGTLRNVHIRPGASPSLVCAPVDLVATLSGDQLNSVLEAHDAKVVASCADGEVRLRLARHLSWGWVDVVPEVVGGHVALRPTAAGRGERAWRFARRLPPRSLRLGLPANSRIVDLNVAPDALRLHVRIDQWRVDYRSLLRLARKD